MTGLGGNIQQRVFDCLPPWPVPLSIFQLYECLPFEHSSIRSAVKNLRELQLVEAVPGKRFSYRRAEKATRPADRRGGPRTKRQRGQPA